MPRRINNNHKIKQQGCPLRSTPDSRPIWHPIHTQSILSSLSTMTCEGGRREPTEEGCEGALGGMHEWGKERGRGWSNPVPPTTDGIANVIIHTHLGRGDRPCINHFADLALYRCERGRDGKHFKR